MHIYCDKSNKENIKIFNTCVTTSVYLIVRYLVPKWKEFKANFSYELSLCCAFIFLMYFRLHKYTCITSHVST